MQPRFARILNRLLRTLTLAAGVQLLGTTIASAQSQPPPPTYSVPGHQGLLDGLAWDSLLKESTPKPGEPMANFVFNVTNTADHNIVIDHVHTSCGCTAAKLPSQPWVLMPHTNGQINVSVNLAGKSGTIYKTITVFSTNADQKILTVKVNLPESPQVVRMRNQQMAQADPQAIFRGQCATCHVDKGRGLLGKALYKESCGICHDATPRASMVPDLHALNHPTDYAFWKTIITEGKPRTMMPAFSDKHGGPLTDEQIESLAQVLTKAFSSNGQVPTPIKTSAVDPNKVHWVAPPLPSPKPN